MYLSGNQVRKKENFNLNWFFYHGDEEKEAGSRGLEGFRPVKLPHDWSLDYPLDEHALSCGSGGYAETGIGWYRKLFDINPQALGQGRVHICFEGVYMLSKVWINGHYLGQHVYGYTPFSYDITEYLNQDGRDNVMDVRVDNSAQPGSRWYSGSGITRNVWLLGVADICVAPYGVWVQAVDISEEKAELKIETELTVKRQSGLLRVETEILSPDGKVCLALNDLRKGETTTVIQHGTVEAPVLWDTDMPALYKAVTRVYENDILTDEVHTSFGIRTALFDKDKGFLLNNRQVKLNGVCIHHDGGCMGAAVPAPIWERRLEKLKEMGVNAIRMAHNPPDTALLDLCDRMGFLVMDEAFDEWRYLKGKELGSNTHESHGYSKWFDLCHEEDLRAMVLRDRNHPGIILWSIGNEVPDQTAGDGYQTARKLKGICKSLDPLRAVTQANDQIAAEPKAAKPEFLNELDVVGYNYVGRWRERAETFYDEDKRTYPQWCMIGTENGGLGGIRSKYAFTMEEKAGWWKRPYYSAPVDAGRLLRFTMTHDYVAGDFMWTGIDYLGESHWPARSSSAGVLDTCGFPKDSFYFYQSIWKRDTPMVHLLPHWNIEAELGRIIPVLGYTSCDSAELILNGKSYGKKSYSYPAYGMTQEYGHFDKTPIPANTDDLFLSWDVPYEPGCIELVGYVDGREAVRETVRTAGNPHAVRLSCYRDTMTADGLDIGQIEIEITDQDGNLCPQAENQIWLTAEGAGSIAGIDNGNPQNHESAKGSGIHAFGGKAFAVVQSDGNAGECRVKAYAQGLEPAEITLHYQAASAEG
ncbi:MAG: DUF4982 domain-containing protein [Lachnospiraceae bacterium]|nr:DUF4982 domain-containing protein [Lachnospiraceae bacterium]